MVYGMPQDDYEDIVLSIKKSDIKRFFDGKEKINVKVYRGMMSNFLTQSMYAASLNKNNNIKLTTRELEVLKCLAEGKNNTKIAKELCVSRYTIKAHVANILQKMDAEDRFQAAIKAITQKII